jgi:hypothetical protein
MFWKENFVGSLVFLVFNSIGPHINIDSYTTKLYFVQLELCSQFIRALFHSNLYILEEIWGWGVSSISRSLF